VNASPATGTTDSVDRWIIVDLERILHLPERLRRLWPAELLPHRNPQDPRIPSRAEAGPGETTEPSTSSASVGNRSASSAKDADSGASSVSGVRRTGPTGSARGLDVLTAWLRGFASELDRGSTRITVVVSSGVETVHLALCLGAGRGHAILTLSGEGLEDFAGHQLLRRIEPPQIATVVDELACLVEHDCVLTLSWAARGGIAGLEFLHRRGGTWFRPVLERSTDSITVDADVEAGDAAVRMLLGAVLARTLAMGVR
jgi:hypothetical protein